LVAWVPARFARVLFVLAFVAGAAAPASAVAIVCGQSIESTITTPTEVDSYTFQAAAGDVVSVSVGGEFRFSSFGVVAVLKNPSNQTVTFRNINNQSAQSPFCGVHQTCETTFPLAVSGTYTLQVSDFMSNATGTYSLTLDTVGGTWNGGSNAPPSPVCGAVADGTSTIACGQTVNGSLGVFADADTYTFFADAGDVVAFTVSRPVGGDVNAVLELFAPGGTLVTFDGGTNYCELMTCQAAPLPATGVYTVKLTDSGLTHLGAYSLTLDSIADSFDGASNGPPSPTCGVPADGARTIACGQRVTGTIGVTGDSDVFVFQADAGEGAALVVEQPSGSALVPMAELFGPNGNFLARASGPAPPVSSGTLATSGVHSVKLTDFDQGEILDQTGAYALTLVSGKLDGATCKAGPLLRCGETVSATIAVGEVDFFTFAARAGDVVRIHAPGGAVAAPVVVGPNGLAVNANAALPSTGIYTIVLRASAGGTYRVTLEAVSGSANGGGNGWPPLVCAQNVSDGTLQIACGQTRNGTLDVVGDTDTYSFLAEAGDVVTLAMNDSVAGFDPVAELFAPGGAIVLLSGDTVCGPSETCVSPGLPATGPYTIRVREPSTATTGAYSVQMSRSPCASDCQDGIDNDGDAQIDFPADAGCSNAADVSEQRECSDGRDNDGDGLVDFAGGDLGCTNANAPVEDPACDDGRDNDADATLDWDGAGAGAADAFCGGVASNTAEATAPAPGCGIGPELAALLPLLAALRRRRRPARA
jgi:hypothetical protein